MSLTQLLQAKQLKETAKKLDEQESELHKKLQTLASDRAQLAQAQAALESDSGANRQLSAELAGESEALSKQRRSLDAREADVRDQLEACDRAVKVICCHWQCLPVAV